MLFNDLINNICSQAEEIDSTEGSWAIIHNTLDICTAVIETSVEEWEYLEQVLNDFLALEGAANLAVFMYVTEHWNELINCIEYSLTTDGAISNMETYLNSITIVIPEDGEPDLQTTLDLALVDIYNESKAICDERHAAEAEAAEESTGEGEKDNDDYVSPIEENPTE